MTVIATRDQQVPTTTVGEFVTVTYIVTEHDGIYRLVASASSDLTLMTSRDKAAVLSRGELTEGQGL